LCDDDDEDDNDDEIAPERLLGDLRGSDWRRRGKRYRILLR
jgi:hypothetical protein